MAHRAGPIALAAALLLGCTPGDARDDVILIVVDTLRAERLGLAGHPRPVSPHIDALAQASVVFTEARAVASWTRPTVASILTGYTPRHHGALRYDEGLRAVPTLATRLGAAGYSSRAVVANPFLQDAGFERGFHSFRNLSNPQRWHVPGDEVTRAALSALPERRGIFLYLHYLDPHDPYEPAEAARRELVRPYAGPVDGSMGFVRGQLLRGLYQPDAADLSHLSDLYDAEIRTVDAALGVLFEGLRERGHWDESWIVLTSDHGEELHDHGGWLHSYTLYEEQLRVPLIVKPPRRLGIAPGRRDAPVSQTDIVPTLLDGLGLAADAVADGPPLEGRSLLPLMHDPGAGDPERTIFSEQGFGQGDGRRSSAYAARQGDLKWIRVIGAYSHHPTPREGECYDLARDPFERENLARSDGQHPCRALADAVEAWRGEERSEGPALQIAPEIEERLRALGYTP